jgi:class 3 adenylate cyclase
MPIERKLAAIMFTDIAGYTAQMSQDEDKAFALIRKKRELLLPLIEQYEGKLIKEIVEEYEKVNKDNN